MQENQRKQHKSFEIYGHHIAGCLRSVPFTHICVHRFKPFKNCANDIEKNLCDLMKHPEKAAHTKTKRKKTYRNYTSAFPVTGAFIVCVCNLLCGVPRHSCFIYRNVPICRMPCTFLFRTTCDSIDGDFSAASDFNLKFGCCWDNARTTYGRR